MSEERPWPGVTRDDDLQLSGSDDLYLNRSDDLRLSGSDDLRLSGSDDLRLSGSDDLRLSGSGDLFRSRSDDLRLSGSDDDHTEAMTSAGAPEPPRPAARPRGAHAAPPPGSVEPPPTISAGPPPTIPAPPTAVAPSVADEDEVPFWLLPPPPRPNLPVAPDPSRFDLRQPDPYQPDPYQPDPYQPDPHQPDPHQPDPHQQNPFLPDDRPRELYREAFPAAAQPQQVGLQDVFPQADRHRPAYPAQQQLSRSAARGARSGMATGVLDRAAGTVDRGLAALGPVADRVRAQPPTRLAVAAAALAVVMVLILVLGTLRGEDPVEAAVTDPTRTSASTVPVDTADITATASSTQAAAGKTTYDAANTLDGKVTTAWNSHGEVDGPGPGITLTYTFAEPVALRSIRLANGYQKTVRNDGRSVDLFDANSRVHRLRVVTDAGEWTWKLGDKKASQVLRKDFGTTSSVTLEIISVYEGAKYTDVGISEVAFTALES